MKKNIHTPVIQELIRLGVSPKNAYRMVHYSKSVSCRLLVKIIRQLMDKGIRVD